jgi:hypothetical protein
MPPTRPTRTSPEAVWTERSPSTSAAPASPLADWTDSVRQRSAGPSPAPVWTRIDSSQPPPRTSAERVVEIELGAHVAGDRRRVDVDAAAAADADLDVARDGLDLHVRARDRLERHVAGDHRDTGLALGRLDAHVAGDALDRQLAAGPADADVAGCRLDREVVEDLGHRGVAARGLDRQRAAAIGGDVARRGLDADQLEPAAGAQVGRAGGRVQPRALGDAQARVHLVAAEAHEQPPALADVDAQLVAVQLDRDALEHLLLGVELDPGLVRLDGLDLDEARRHADVDPQRALRLEALLHRHSFQLRP